MEQPDVHTTTTAARYRVLFSDGTLSANLPDSRVFVTDYVRYLPPKHVAPLLLIRIKEVTCKKEV